MADRYTGLRDMFDGGGRGQAGPRFEGGGILSAAANAVARPAGSRERGEPDMRTGLGGFARDMIDGGGFNRSGPTFQGGPFGGLFGALLNSGGVRPMGYQERLGSVRPQMRPPMPAPAYAAPAPAAPMGMPAYTQPSAMGMPVPAPMGMPAYTQPSAMGMPTPRGTMNLEEWVATTFENGILPSGITQEALMGGYETYLNEVAQLGPRYGS